jgi:tetratricopeptide (TPR) repeat protein
MKPEELHTIRGGHRLHGKSLSLVMTAFVMVLAMVAASGERLAAQEPAGAGEAAAEGPEGPAAEGPEETAAEAGSEDALEATAAEAGSEDALEAGAAEEDVTAPGDGAAPPAEEGKGLGGLFQLFSRGSRGSEDGEEPVEVESDESLRQVVNLRERASRNMRLGRLPDAIRAVNELIGIKPYDPDVHLALGLCYRKLGKHKDALKKYQDVLDLGGPKNLISLLTAEAHAASGQDRAVVLQHLKEAAQGGRNVINDVGLLSILNDYQDDSEFIRQALQLEKFELAQTARKFDPFTNPFPTIMDLKEPEPGDEGTAVSERPGPQEQERMLKDTKRAYARVQFYIKLEDEAKAMKAYNELRAMFEKKDLITVPKIANDFRFLMNRMPEIEVQIEGIRLKYYYNLAKNKLKDMRESFLDGEFKRVEEDHVEVSKICQEMTQANESYKPVADRILETAGQWLSRAQVRQEFEARKPAVQGIVIADDGKMAVLNNRIVKQGEALEDFRVVKVESNRVTFRYKGEEIPLVFRRY